MYWPNLPETPTMQTLLTAGRSDGVTLLAASIAALQGFVESTSQRARSAERALRAAGHQPMNCVFTLSSAAAIAGRAAGPVVCGSRRREVVNEPERPGLPDERVISA